MEELPRRTETDLRWPTHAGLYLEVRPQGPNTLHTIHFLAGPGVQGLPGALPDPHAPTAENPNAPRSVDNTKLHALYARPIIEHALRVNDPERQSLFHLGKVEFTIKDGLARLTDVRPIEHVKHEKENMIVALSRRLGKILGGTPEPHPDELAPGLDSLLLLGFANYLKKQGVTRIQAPQGEPESLDAFVDRHTAGLAKGQEHLVRRDVS